MNEQFFTNLNGYEVKDKYALHTYDSVAVMKGDTKLKNGMHVKTKGYYTPNDGGQCEYIITNTEDNTKYQEELTNGLYANLLIDNYMKPEQFGAYGDGIHDDTRALQNALNCSGKVITKGIYLVNNSININNSINMLDDSYIKADETLTDIVVNIAKNNQLKNREYIVNVDSNSITDIGIAVGVPKNSILKLTVINAGKTGIVCNYERRAGNNENQFTCTVYGNNEGTTEKGVIVNNYDSIFHSIVTKDCQYGVYLDHGELIAECVHSWLSSDLISTLWDNSYVIYNSGYFNSIVKWLYQDTVKYGIGGIAPYGNITYFEYLNSLEDTTNYQDYKNVYVTSGPTRLTIDTFRNLEEEKQQLLYQLATNSTRNEFGILNKNGIDSNVSNLNPIDIFTDCDNAPQIGSFYCKYTVSNLPQSTNGYLKSEIIGSSVMQKYIPTNFNSNSRYWIRFRELNSDTWGSWILINFEEQS